MVDAGVREQISNGLGLSSDIKVPELWLFQLFLGSILVALLRRRQLVLQILDRLLIRSDDALLL